MEEDCASLKSSFFFLSEMFLIDNKKLVGNKLICILQNCLEYHEVKTTSFR